MFNLAIDKNVSLKNMSSSGLEGKDGVGEEVCCLEGS